MSEQEKKRQRIYVLNVKTKLKFLLSSKQRMFFFFLQKKSFLKKMEVWGLKKKTKRRLFNCSRSSDGEGPQNSNKKIC